MSDEASERKLVVSVSQVKLLPSSSSSSHYLTVVVGQQDRLCVDMCMYVCGCYQRQLLTRITQAQTQRQTENL